MSETGLTTLGARPASTGSDDLGFAGSAVLVTAVLAALYLVSAPLLLLLAAAFRGPGDLLPFEPGATWTLDHLRAVFQDPVLYRDTLRDTILFVAGSVSVTFILAFSLAWLVERTDLPGRSLLGTLILVPLLVPTVMLGVAWIQLFGPNAGWVNLFIRKALNLSGAGPLDIFTRFGLVACQSGALVPFMFLLLSGALRTMNPALEEASSVSGARPFTTFLRITWPVLRPGILAPLILVTLVTLEQFDMPLVVGLPARVDIFSTRIFYELTPDSGLPIYGRAAAVALPFLIAALLLLVVYNRLVRQAGHYVTITPRGYRVKRLRLGRWRWPALAFVSGYVSLGAVLPALALVWTSLYGNQPPSWEALSHPMLEAYRRVLSDPGFGGAVGNTLLVAGLSAALVTIVGTLLACVIARTRLPGRHAVDILSVASIGIPSVIAGLSTMLLYLTLPLPIYGTIWILVLAYSYRLAVTTRLGRAGLMQIDRQLEEASAVSGASWIATLRRVVLPLLAPSLAAGFVLLFIVGVREFTLPMILASQDNVVLGVVLWRLFEDGHAAEAAAVASLVMLIVAPLVIVIRRLLARRGELV